MVKKVVRFTSIGINIYNLGFGDINEETGDISDMVVTNNNDSQKVLATIALIVQNFIFHYPEGLVIAKGSTHSRTRLYQMGIANHLQVLNDEFKIYGLRNNEWEMFELKRSYRAFLVRRKQFKFDLWKRG